MKTFLFFILSLFVENISSQEMDSIQKKVFILNVKASHVSYPIENLFLLEQITKNKKMQFLEKLSADPFIASNEFKQLYFLLSNSEINSGYIVEKRIKDFFINKEGSTEKLQVTFESKDYYWIPIEIKKKKNDKKEFLLETNNPLFAISLDSTADSYHFQEFARYWNKQPDRSFNIIPTNSQDAVIEHVIFFSNENNSKKIEKVFSISLGYFRPKNTPKNGWLITGVAEELNTNNYDLSKPRNYIPPIYASEIPQKNTSKKNTGIINKNIYRSLNIDCSPNINSAFDNHFVFIKLPVLQDNALKLNNCNENNKTTSIGK